MRTKEAAYAAYNWPTPAEAAELLGGVSAEHVIRLVKAGELRARNVALSGTRYRIDPASVEAFNRRRMVEPSEAA
jgi:excisionase family DNA binding protein